MHLSSITIKGFKSFPERTRLEFSPGVSVIVGPNGCGKSNITDAVLWALGEQSPLSVRGQTMQDMIFTGGDGVGPRRYAEVEVVLRNDQPATDPAGADAGAEQPAGLFSEVAIRRRLDRSGDGVYWINGARCRLIDVVETLADANLGREMHSVISQGRVEEIVLSKPRERRLLVEEAAGLGKHRKRRRRTQLKLERTQGNLDRALDIEREARSRLRPLKRQAQAAEIHARLEREANELRARLVGADLAARDAELVAGERTAGDNRSAREAIETELANANERRSEVEERLARRDRERTETWGRLAALRAAHERLSARAEALAERRAELTSGLDRRRAALGALAAELEAAVPADGERDPIEAGLARVGEALTDASAALAAAQDAPPEGDRAIEVGRVREASERAARAAGRVEDLLGRRRQDSLERRVAEEAKLLARLSELLGAVADARDAAGERAAILEGRMLGAGEGDDLAAELRACSKREAEIQARLMATAETVTEAEVKVAHLRDRRDETAAELARLAAALGRGLGATHGAVNDEERGEIERKLERLGRRREQLGPVNPLAQAEYEEAQSRVQALEEQRTDLETALTELEGLISETDRRIHAAFEETFEATERNFQELIEHLFPGGRGRLRLVDDRRGPRPVLGGVDPAGADAGADGESPSDERGQDVFAGAEEPAGGDSEFEGQGVEIEVTPAGKATRRLSLLSGGEKSLVALAFVFAVFLARPSPFYILDEVEAALDDANIDRFLQLIRRFSDRAQFVIVTHQKRTMDAADILYGVSMKDGVTRVISRRLSHPEEEAVLGEAEAEAA